MTRRSIVAELVAGALGAAIIVAVAMLLTPAYGAIRGPAARGCATTDDVAAFVHQRDADARVTFYRGDAATAFAQAVRSMFDLDPDELADVGTFGVFIWSDPHEDIELRFFDAMGCDAGGAATDLDTLREIGARMGTGA